MRTAVPAVLPHVSRREWTLAAVTSLALALLLLVPYWLGYRLAPPDQASMGLVMNPEDSQTYFAKMLQGYDGAWRYTIPFTAEAHEPAFVGGYYLLLGHLARWLGLTVAGIWHAARFLAGVFLFVSTFAFCAAFLDDRRKRWTAFMLALLGAGGGWLLFLLGQPDWLGAFPVDFKQPEAFLLFTALTFPHVATGTGLVLLSVLLLPAAWHTPSWFRSLALGGLFVLIGVVYPFLLYLVIAVTALFALWQVARQRSIPWRRLAWLALAFGVPAPLYVYYAATLRGNVAFQLWEAQAGLPSAPWPHVVLAYSLWLVLALAGWRRTGREPRYHVLWAWVLAAALLLYAPLNAQRRFVQGVVVPLAVLAAVGWWTVAVPWLARRRWSQRLFAGGRYTPEGLGRLATVALLAVMSLSNAYLLGSVSLTAAVQQPFPLFRPAAEVAAGAWLRANTAAEELVLGDYETGNYVAARAGNRVVIGHWAETGHYDEKQAAVDRFFDPATDDAWRRAYLAENNIGYVWVGPEEEDGGTFTPGSYLTEVFREGEVTIYRVVKLAP